MIRILADMNISPLTVERIRGRGFDIVRVSEILPVNTPDRIVLELARSEGRILISQDLDFSRILALENRTSPSLITIRMMNCDPESVAERLLAAFPAIEDSLISGCAISVDDCTIRLRPLPIDLYNKTD
jgi:predicted nuclease of predicted toxin-antitoxin system